MNVSEVGAEATEWAALRAGCRSAGRFKAKFGCRTNNDLQLLRSHEAVQLIVGQ